MGIDNLDDLELVDAAVGAAIKRAARGPQVSYWPATVRSYDPSGLAYVHFDGDPDSEERGVRNLAGRLLSGDRVNVKFTPGGGALIEGRRTDDQPRRVGADVTVTAIEPPFAANWAPVSALDSLSFRRTSTGLVVVSGLIQWTGGVGLAPLTTITTLPLEYAPVAYADESVRTRGPWIVSSGGGGTSQLSLDSDGVFLYIGGTGPEIAVAVEIIYDPSMGG